MRRQLLETILKSVPESSVYSGKSVLVTGASGQIGLNVLALALARGAQVVAVVHATPLEFTHPRLTQLQADLTAPASAAFPRADILIHTAPIWVLPHALPAIMAAGTGRAVVFGSQSVFGKRESANAAEQAVVDSLVGGEEKVARLAAERGLDLTVLRPTMTYGMGLDVNITRMARTIRRFYFVPICNPASGLRQPVHAGDLAEAALAAWDKPATFGKSYNLGGGDQIPYRAMVQRLFVHLGRTPRLVPLPLLPQALDAVNRLFPALHINGEIARRMNRDLVSDNGPAARDFGYQPRAFLAGDVIL
ncbi:MAG TPA: NAD-dependent epimerase/dehydratase family protein [Xanthobacteraceae bacterium]|nr:NAD-dependent epimerase/dehydratase family protein [Xanthobacteraceae bacterium]